MGSTPARPGLKWCLLLAMFILNTGFLFFFLHKNLFSTILMPQGEPIFATTTTMAEEKSIDGSNNQNNKNENGWKDIHVFYGDRIHGGKGGKSQTDQDKLVATLFREKKNGFFVDLAANDALLLSNTYQLEQQHDWNGICIEPNSVYWRGLSYRKCEVVAAVTGTNRMEEVKFAIPGNGKRNAAGGILKKGFDPKPRAVVAKFFTVPLLEILQRYKAPHIIDYLSLDVEGAEYFIMKDFPFDQFNFRTATIERPKQELIDLLYTNGYEYLAGNSEFGDETLWVHKSFKDSLDLNAITRLGWLTGSTMRYPRSSPGAKPVLDTAYKCRINGTIYEINQNALVY